MSHHHHYKATHHDRLTAELRTADWRPSATYGCGCAPHRLCDQHAHIRAAEHNHPELIP